MRFLADMGVSQRVVRGSGPRLTKPTDWPSGSSPPAGAGDVKLAEQMFTEHVEVHSDGGGRASAARVVIRGRDRAARFLARVFSKRRRHCEMHATTVLFAGD